MLIFIGFYVFVIPLCILMHEIGHAIGMILTSDERAHVHLGDLKDTSKRTFGIGRIHFHIRWSFFGFCSWGGQLNNKQRLASLIGGPLMSLVMAVLFWRFVSYVPEGNLHILLTGTARFCAVTFFSSVIPIKYPRWMGFLGGYPSDGLQILNIMKKRRSKQ